MVHLYKIYVERCPSEAMIKDVFYLAPKRKCLDSDKVCYATDILNIFCLEFKLLNFCSFSVVHVKPSWAQ